MALGLTLLTLACGAVAASAKTFGSTPLNISTGPHGEAPNGPSAQPSISGDNRVVHYVAFSSQASGLVTDDHNNASDVFVWTRPSGVPDQLGDGTLQLASVNNAGIQLNGGSDEPSLDGSLTSRPHCVAFATTATNASTGDATPDSDIYVRDLRRHKTIWVSRNLSGAATNPTIAGNCSKVAFQANGNVWVSSVAHPRSRRVARGSDPSFSRDGESLTYVSNGGVVFRHGATLKRLGRGSDPRVSDASADGWAVTFNSGGNLQLGLIKNGRARVRVAVRNAMNGGVTSHAADRGIVVWARGDSVNYLNRHTGNSDDLAYANDDVTQVTCSARANLVAFMAAGGPGFIDAPGNTQPSIYVKWLPR